MDVSSTNWLLTAEKKERRSASTSGISTITLTANKLGVKNNHGTIRSFSGALYSCSFCCFFLYKYLGFFAAFNKGIFFLRQKRVLINRGPPFMGYKAKLSSLPMEHEIEAKPQTGHEIHNLANRNIVVWHYFYRYQTKWQCIYHAAQNQARIWAYWCHLSRYCHKDRSK